ncbi:hypothetical protein M8J71_02120 [Pseudarthrobacter sp. R1]|uniref:hypothetical protein n=1 Tax=Pseudarthrobacter sp. R1 TaxID=2944934 RepID=UPI00210CA8ED|nr:hypothetical protein [Pseudarthrobacter sp. R1]MCQ6269297.1 hypothetical protein [Pseudarthrobacter sp. R1]
MHTNGKPDHPRQALDVVAIGEALTDVITTPEGTRRTAAAAAAVTVSRAGARAPTEDEFRTGLQHRPQLQMHA